MRRTVLLLSWSLVSMATITDRASGQFTVAGETIPADPTDVDDPGKPTASNANSTEDNGASLEIEDEGGDDSTDLFDLSFEELMRIPVTLPSGVESPWWQSPSAIFVITEDDIRRSGHRILAELFRMVPGMEVSRLNSHKWAITSRGFNNRWSNKLLVLIDGRSIYDHMFGGVIWAAHDIPIENIEKIEIIRGPGATLWEANAVNGVINIITKKAKDTQGGLVTGGYGTHEGSGFARYGVKLGEDDYVRVWGKYANYEGHEHITGENGIDDWDNLRSGFRWDLGLSDDVNLTVQSEVFEIDNAGLDQTITGRRIFEDRLRGGFLRTELKGASSTTSGWTLGAYYDVLDNHQSSDIADNGNLIKGFREERDVLDLEFRHHFEPLDNHQILWGVGYRYISDQMEPVEEFLPDGSTFIHAGFDPDSRDLDTFSGFIQDTISLTPDEWTLMVGSKFEHNDFTGFEVQPSVRISLTPDQARTIWAAVSRSVRTSVRFAQDFSAAGFRIGDPHFDAEVAWSYELGYRHRLFDPLTMDLATFYVDYDGLRDIENFAFSNLTDAETWGVEAAFNYQARDDLRLGLSYAMIRVDADGPNASTRFEKIDAEHRASARIYWDIHEDVEINNNVYYVDAVRYPFDPNVSADPYVRWDLGITWRPEEDWSLSLWGQNLLDKRHLEDVSGNAETNTEIERTVYAQFSLAF